MTLRAPLLALALALAACGDGRGAEAPRAFDRTRPHWEDAFDRVPEVLVVVHPQAIGRDRVYGPFLKSVSRAIAARAPQTGGARAAEIFESCEEVIFGVRERGKDDAVVVLRGVRADFDPARVVDEHGVPMWRPAGMVGGVQELLREGEGRATSLFVLTERTWVVAIGDARERTREAFAHPFGRPAPVSDDRALVLVRLDGPSLVRAVPRLGARGAPLEPVGRRLDAVSLALRPGSEGLEAKFVYAEEGAAAFAEETMKELASAIGREGTSKLKWLGAAKVDREAAAVTARVGLPPGVLEGLPAVTAGELGL